MTKLQNFMKKTFDHKKKKKTPIRISWKHFWLIFHPIIKRGRKKIA